MVLMTMELTVMMQMVMGDNACDDAYEENTAMMILMQAVGTRWLGYGLISVYV